MPPPDDAPDMGYNSMQQQAGLLPAIMAVPPPIIFPGQISAMLAYGGPGAAMAALPVQNSMAAIGGFGGMGGYPSPQTMGMPSLGPANPYAALAGNPTSVFSPSPAAPPPMYAGPQMIPGLFGGMPAPSMFNTPYAASVERRIAEENQSYANYASYAGIGARVGTGMAAGLAGVALGGRFGGVPGAVIGGLGAMFGAEHFGVGQFAQNTFMEQVMAPRIQQRAFAAGIEHQSQSYVPFGSGPMGVGFNSEDAHAAAARITALGNSAGFRRETFDKFNASDLATITQGAGSAGLLGGVRDVDQMTSRVREVAKSLSAFMELAQEPDIQRALTTMGNLRSSGLNLSETLGAVQSGRSFARLAGMSFQEMAEVGGGAGSAMFQNFGMSAGAGFRAGMANLGMATASQNAGILNPAMMSMLRGPQGLAAINNQFSANMLSMPMLAPAMMTAGGGLNASALQSLMSGGQNLFSMTGVGANNLSAMTGRMGVEGLGMAVSMQPMLRDQIARILQAQGPSVQRNMEDSQILGLMRGMGMRGSAGFITAARAAGLDETAAVARAQEVASPSFYGMQRQQLAVQRQEARAEADRIREESSAGIMDVLRQNETLGGAITGAEDFFHTVGTRFSRATGGLEARPLEYRASTDSALRREDRLVRGAGFTEYMRRQTRPRMGGDEALSPAERVRLAYNLSRATGGAGLVSMVEGVGYGAALSDQQLRQGARDYNLGGAMSETIMYGGAIEERNAARRMGATFGTGAQGMRAMGAFAQRIAGMNDLNENVGTMFVNAAIRGSVGYAAGMLPIDPGNMVGGQARRGTDYRDAFIGAMRESGMSAAEAGRVFDRNPTLALQQAAPLTRLMQTNLDRDQMERSIEQGRAFSPRGGRALEGFVQDREEAARTLFGTHGGQTGRESSAAFMRVMDSVEGVGREGTRKAERSRYFIASMAAASSTVDNDAQSARAGQAAIRRIAEEATRQGYSSDEINLMIRRAQGLRGRFASGDAATAASDFMRNAGAGRSGRDIINTFERADVAYRTAQAGENVAQGATVIRGAGGELANLVKDARGQTMDAQHFDQAQFEQNLSAIGEDPERLRALSQQGAFGRSMAQAVERYRRGDQRALGEIRSMMQNAGKTSQSVSDEVRSGFGYRARSVLGSLASVDRIVRQFYSPEQTEEYAQREIASRLSPTSEGERTANRGILDSAAAQARMIAQGIGGGNDQLVEASRNLNQVAELFRDTISSGNIGRLINPP